MNTDMNWRIATTEAGLTRNVLISLGLPIPDVFTYSPYAEEVGVGGGAIKTHGYKSAEVLWRNLTPYQLFLLREFVDDARASSTGELFMTVPLMDGTTIGMNWADVSARPFIENPTPHDPLVGSTGLMYRNVTLRLNNIVIENSDPTF